MYQGTTHLHYTRDTSKPEPPAAGAMSQTHTRCGSVKAAKRHPASVSLRSETHLPRDYGMKRTLRFNKYLLNT